MSASVQQQEAALRAQLAALEEQLAVARMQESLSKMPAATDPDGEYEEVVEDDDDAEVIVIEELIDDGEEFEEVIVVEEEVVDDEEEDYVGQMAQEYEEVVEEVTIEGDEDDPVQPTETPPAPVSNRHAPPPMVPLVDPPKEEVAPAAPAAVAAPPPPGPPQAVPARQAGPANQPSALATNMSNTSSPTEEAAKPRKKWVPMSQRFPEKFKAKDPKAAKSLAAASAGKPVLGAPVSASDKAPKAKPIPYRAKVYPSVAASPKGKETPLEKLLGPQLLKNVQMQKVSLNAAVQGNDLIALYFGAAWQKPCKTLHQPLIDFYRLVTKDAKLEMVYMSADRTLFEFKDIFQKFDFLAMPTGTTALKNNLTRQLKVVDLPLVAVLEASTGNVVTVTAADQIRDLPARDKAAALQLVQSWKQIKAVPLHKFQPPARPKGAAVNKGNVIWRS